MATEAVTGGPTTLLTLDIEDWSQSVADVFGPQYAVFGPDGVEPTDRVVHNTQRLLRLLGAAGARATCFVLGSVARRFPALVRDIQSAGHEVASHGYGHRPVYTLSREEFVEDVRRGVGMLEDITGRRVRGYRAPYFSITRRSLWALEILAGLGLEYDASTFPIHPRLYRFPGWDGIPEGERYPHCMSVGGARLVELPVTTVRRMGQNLPFAGGAFLRFLPLEVFRGAIRDANRAGHPAIMYLHPHDLDAEELRRPFARETLRVRLLRWGLNLGRSGNERRLTRLLGEFRFIPVAEWLRESGMSAGAPGAGNALACGEGPVGQGVRSVP